jgi:hypothetical protein
LNGAIELARPEPQLLALLRLKCRKFRGKGGSYMPAFRIVSDEILSVATFHRQKRPPRGEAEWGTGHSRQVAALQAFVIVARKPTYIKTS